MEKLAKVPPEKTSKSERRGLPLKRAVSVVLSIPAAGMCPASLKTTKTRAVISIFFLMEGVLTTFEKNWPTDFNISVINYTSIQENSQPPSWEDELNAGMSSAEDVISQTRARR
jgi:hypothetical protein